MSAKFCCFAPLSFVSLLQLLFLPSVFPQLSNLLRPESTPFEYGTVASSMPIRSSWNSTTKLSLPKLEPNSSHVTYAAAPASVFPSSPLLRRRLKEAGVALLRENVHEQRRLRGQKIPNEDSPDETALLQSGNATSNWLSHDDDSNSRRRHDLRDHGVAVQRTSRRKRARWISDLSKWLPRDLEPEEELPNIAGREGILQKGLSRTRLKTVYLSYYRVAHPPKTFNFECRGGVCPHFTTCRRGLKMCHFPDLEDPVKVSSKPPLNCRQKGVNRWGKPVLDLDYCHSRDDRLYHDPRLWQISLLQNSFINSPGHVFNRKYFYNRQGCTTNMDFTYPPGTVVRIHDTVVNMAYWNGFAFYHVLLECIPSYYMLATSGILAKAVTLGIPVAFRKGQDSFFGMTEAITGGSNSEFNKVYIRDIDELLFAHTIIQPLYDWCGRSSRVMWRRLRQKFFVPEDGFPMFNADWSEREREYDQAEDDPSSNDWHVVLAKRYGARQLEQGDEVEELTRKIFASRKVEIFDGSSPILQAKRLFNRAQVFIAVHGAAMSNMVFLPFNATVLEIRPASYMNACYHHLAEVCDLHYYMVYGAGDKDSHASVNVSEVEEVLRQIEGTVSELMVYARR